MTKTGVKYLASPVKMSIVRAKNAGQSVRDVGRLFNVNPSTVSRICQRWNAEQTVKRRRKSGRPRKLTTHQSRRLDPFFSCNRRWLRLIRLAKEDPFITSVEIQAYALDHMDIAYMILSIKRFV